MASTKVEEKKSWLGQARDFWGESVAELKKVSTPTRAETIQATIVTLFIMLFVALCLTLMDFVFDKVMGALLT
ncbi:MAG: preprotein translocase subunit SecE [Bdellovibrionales bacterium]|nr:preprotein translocase subunit SecE [Bdellovibrionales bacterium]